jgi:hypothetical protein
MQWYAGSPQPIDDIFINKLRHAGTLVFSVRSPLVAWTRVNRRVFLCLLYERDKDIFPAHLPNNLGGVTPGVRERTSDKYRTKSYHWTASHGGPLLHETKEWDNLVQV